MARVYPYKTLPEDWDAFYEEQVNEGMPELQPFYNQPPVAADRLLRDTDFAALDIETTGLNAQEDDIVSIGLIPFNSQRVFIAGAQYWVVRSRRLTPESVIIHGLTHSEVNKAPMLRDVLPQVIQALAGKQIVVHYRYMEREFFRQATVNTFSSGWLFPVIDTLEIEVQFLKKQQSLLSRWRRKQLPSLRLPNVRPRYQLPTYESHNALTDALATAELWQAQIQYQQLQNKPVRKLWT